MEERALRYNEGKLRLDLLPAEFTEYLVEVFDKGRLDKDGKIKYPDRNWLKSLGTDDHAQFRGDRFTSLQRHVHYLHKGEREDGESRLHHGKLAAWNALVVVYYDLNERAV